MPKKTIGLICIIIIAISFICVQFLVIRRVLIQPEDLMEIAGIIEDVQKIEIPNRTLGCKYAYAIKVIDEPLEFAIHEKNSSAYEYLEYHNVIGKRAKILYDKTGFNANGKRTYHVYSLRVNGLQILDIRESKQSDRFGLFIFGVFDILIIIMFFYVKRKKKLSKKGLDSAGLNRKLNRK
jgi:hypothetical protein